MIVVNMDPSLPLDETITGKTDFLITEHGALGTVLIAERRSVFSENFSDFRSNSQPERLREA